MAATSSNEENGSRKRKISGEGEEVDPNKRIGLEKVDAIREAEVGIEEYVSKELVPIEGGIIKQRYSDFHVREVDRGGKVCRITSLEPTPSEEGGSGLLEKIKGLQANGKGERDDVKEEIVEEGQSEQEQIRAWDLSEERIALLNGLLGEEGVPSLRDLWTSGPIKGEDDRSVTSLIIDSKEKRTAAHQLIREAFAGRLITETGSADDGSGSVIRIKWGSDNQKKAKPKTETSADLEANALQFKDKSFIHFLLQKTNRDSQDALNIVSRSLGLLNRGGGSFGSRAVKELTVAGTKDKRGVTVQQVSLKRGRRTLDEVWRSANGLDRHGRDDKGGKRGRRGALDALKWRSDRGVRIAHLTYADTPLRLGELGGNAFEIVLRNIKVRDRRRIDDAFDVLKQKGFINYFGMQRFGTSTISTHKVGIMLLRGDYRNAIELIMAPRDGDPDGVKQAREAYCSGRLKDAFQLFPHFNVPERSIVQRMRDDRLAPFEEGTNPSMYESADWRKYFSALPRTLRTMYVHAYQSYVWNKIASERVRRFGLDRVVVGDFVRIGEEEWVEVGGEVPEEDLDDDARANGAGNGSHDLPWMKKVKLIESEEEAQRHSIHDVMIAMPGTHIRFLPGSWAETVYDGLLAEDGLTADDIVKTASKAPELTLTGDYRKLLHLPKDVSYEVVRYADPNVNLIQSDEDRILGLDAVPESVPFVDGAEAEKDPFVALIVRFTLGVSAYATMALREVLKQETSSAHQRELTMKCEDRKRAESG